MSYDDDDGGETTSLGAAEKIDDSDFIPPDLAQAIKNAEDIFHKEMTDIAKVPDHDTIVTTPNNQQLPQPQPQLLSSSNPTYLDDSTMYEEMTPAVGMPPVFPTPGGEEEQKVLRELEQQRRPKELQLLSEFNNEVPDAEMENDSTLNLTSGDIIMNNEASEKNLIVPVSPIEAKNEQEDTLSTPRSTTVHSNRNIESGHEMRTPPVKDIIETFETRASIGGQQSEEEVVKPSSEEKAAIRARVSERKKRMDEQLRKVKEKRDSLGKGDSPANTRSMGIPHKSPRRLSESGHGRVGTTANRTPLVKSDSSTTHKSKLVHVKPIAPSSRLVVPTIDASKDQEEPAVVSEKNTPKIKASSRLLQTTNTNSADSENTSSPIIRPSSSPIRSSSRLLQPRNTNVVKDGAQSAMNRERNYKPMKPLGSVKKLISTSSRLLKTTTTLEVRAKKKVVESSAEREYRMMHEHRGRMKRTMAQRAKYRERTSSGVVRTKAAPTEQPTLTIPEAPKFATTARLGEKEYPAVTESTRELTDPNPITRAFGSPTHPMPHRPPTSESMSYATAAPLTIPETPNFSTTKRNGKHRYSLGPNDVSSMGDLVSPPFAEKVGNYDKSMMRTGKATPIPDRKQMKITIPRPPKFSESRRHVMIEKPASPTFAEVMENYSKSVRRNSTLGPTSNYEPCLTTPRAPKFSQIPPRPLPKSAAEKEEEMMANVKPFKARPVSSGVYHGSVGTKTKIVPRSITKQKPFKLTIPPGPLSKSAAEKEEEMLAKVKPFKARPVSSGVYHGSVGTKTKIVPRSITKQKPFKLTTNTRHSVVHDPPFPPKDDDKKISKAFRARPMPKLDYKSPKSTTSHRFRPTVPKAPRLSVSNKSSREAAKENIKVRLKEKAEMKKVSLIQKSSWIFFFFLLFVTDFVVCIFVAHLLHQQQMNQQNTPREKFVPTVPTPFRLRSDERGDCYRQIMNEKAREEAELSKTHRFKARSFVNKPPSVIPKPKIREATSPKPFNLECISRHKAFEASFKTKVHDEEVLMEQQSRVHKANPIPSSNDNPFTPQKRSANDQSDISFQTPDLSLEERLKCRHEFDEAVRLKHQHELETSLQLDEQAHAEEMEEIKRLRRLPVSEGGMAFTAKPIPSNLRLRATPSSIADAR